MVWWGARKGRVATSAWWGDRTPATEWILVVARASSGVVSGRMEGTRRASMVLPEPGGADHQQVVATGSGYFQGALGVFLAADFGKIVGVAGLAFKDGGQVQVERWQPGAAREDFHRFDETGHAVDEGAIGHGRLAGIGLGQDDAVDIVLAHVHSYGEGAAHRSQRAVERKFAQQHELAQSRRLDLCGGDQNTDGNG